MNTTVAEDITLHRQCTASDQADSRELRGDYYSLDGDNVGHLRPPFQGRQRVRNERAATPSTQKVSRTEGSDTWLQTGSAQVSGPAG